MCIYEGKEYGSDTGRIIRKYDIYICDLGEPVDNNLGKKRPCVIIQSDKFNCPKQNRYIVAPIRSDNAIRATKDNLRDIVEARREVGRLYVPIEMEPDKFSFIDITRIESVQSNNIKVYKCSIINPEVKKKISLALHELMFSDDEDIIFNNKEITNDEKEVLNENNNANALVTEIESSEPVNETTAQIEDKNTNEREEKQTNKKKSTNQICIPENFAEVYDKWLSGELTDKMAMKELGVSNAVFYNIANKYDADNNINRKLLRQQKREKAAEKLINNKENAVDNEKSYSFVEAYELVVTNQMTVDDAAYIFAMSKEDFIKHMIDYEKQESQNFNKYQYITSKQRNRVRTPMPVDFTRTYLQWTAKMINGVEAAQQLDMNYNKFIDFAHKYKNFKECNFQK